MTSFIRINVSRFLNSSVGKYALADKNTFIRGISGKTLKVGTEVICKPAPYKYKEKSYNIFTSLFDKTTSRFDENSKIIVVEGPIAAGKSKFAKELAKELDMLYMPEANLDMYYINEYGYDLRKLDDQLPEPCRSFDVNNFLVNPKHRLTAAFQIRQYTIKFSQYIDALAHVLSTGQGVVLDRCVYSDFVFAEAMCDQGYLSKPARRGYYDVRNNSIDELLRPHLVIYLDLPVAKVEENIKKRNISYEKNSPALTTKYLNGMEKHYKQNYLKNISKHSELLVYDWSEEGEVEVVVEDIERIDFDHYDDQDPKMKDWLVYLEEDWGILRNKYADKKNFLMTYCNVPLFDIPELVIDAEEAAVYHDVINNAPGQKYMSGYNSSMGDSTLLNAKTPHRDTLPLVERRIL